MPSFLPQKNDIENWSAEQLSVWLNQRNMSEVADVFLKKGIDGRQMLNLREEILIIWGRELKIRMRLELLKLIKEIKNQGDIFSSGIGERKADVRHSTDNCTPSKLSFKNPSFPPCSGNNKKNETPVTKVEDRLVSTTETCRQEISKSPPNSLHSRRRGKLPAPPDRPIINHWIRQPQQQYRSPPPRPRFDPPSISMAKGRILMSQHPDIPASESSQREHHTQADAIKTTPSLKCGNQISDPYSFNSHQQRTVKPLPAPSAVSSPFIMTSTISKPVKDNLLQEPTNLQDRKYFDLGGNKRVHMTYLYRRLMLKDFFHMVSRSDAEHMLSSDEMFLIRPSTHTTNPLTLSVCAHGTISHISIRLRLDGKFALGLQKSNETAFGTVDELVKYHRTKDINKEDGSTILLQSTPPKC